MHKYIIHSLLVVSVLLALSGCATHSGDPVAPETDYGLSGGSKAASADSSAVLWGYYNVQIDPADFSVTLTPDRSAMFLCNVVNFINNKTPSPLQVEVLSSEVFADYIDLSVNVSITHPFPGWPQFNGYDVRGIFMGDGTASMDYNDELVYPVYGVDQTMRSCNDLVAGGADGYTRWFNIGEFTTGGMPLFSYTQGNLATPGFAGTATLCPYKYFADGLGSDENLWEWLNDHSDLHGVFSSSASNTRNYGLRFPTGKFLNFGYAIIANWEGLEPIYHPANAPESPFIEATVTDSLYYVDDTNKGGSLIVDFSVFGWEYQPSTIFIESTVLSGVHAFDPMDIDTVTTQFFTSYSVAIPADNIQGTENNEFWIIAEYSAFDYTNQFGVQNLADTDPLASCFRYDLAVSDTEPGCPTPQILKIIPKIAITGAVIDNAKIKFSNTAVPGPDLAAELVRSGEPTITGTDVQWVDNNTITADFDLGGAATGYWDLVVTNGCGGEPGVSVGIFKVVPDYDPSIIDTGGLPDPKPTSSLDHLNFCVLGDDTNGNAGVYYFYAVGDPPPGDASYQIMRYPLDYSQDGECHFTLLNPFGYGMNELLGGPQWPAAIEATSSGAVIFTSAYPGPIQWAEPTDGRGPVYWCSGESDGALSNGYVYFDMRFVDIETTFDCESEVWGFWCNNPAGVDGATSILMSPYGSNDYGSHTGFFPVDHAGSVDGQISDMETYKHTIDNEPQGISDPFNAIFYYLEGAPDEPGIEVLKVAMSNIGYESLCTIDDALVGVPVDISCMPTYEAVDGAETNWLYVLEDNGDKSWQVAVFDQYGTLIDRTETSGGTPIALDCDTVNIEAHTWYEADSDIYYSIIGY